MPNDKPDDKPAAKDAAVSITLRADSGYITTENARIRPDQWRRICEILEEV